jgi:hypothetical protein
MGDTGRGVQFEIEISDLIAGVSSGFQNVKTCRRSGLTNLLNSDRERHRHGSYIHTHMAVVGL